MKIWNKWLVSSIIIFWAGHAVAQTPTFKAVLDGSTGSHQLRASWEFVDRAPLNWTNYFAGANSNVLESAYGSGLNWDSDFGRNYIRMAMNNGFDLAYFYGSDDPGGSGGFASDSDEELFYVAELRGCAVITRISGVNSPGIEVMNGTEGPLTAMTVSCGDALTTANLSDLCNKHGPQLEFIDNDNDCTLSFTYGVTASKYATLKSENPAWNVFDVRQALRQTCTYYTNGWNEFVGYGFPQVITFTNASRGATNDTPISQPYLPTNAADLDAGPPLQPKAQWTSSGQLLLTWYNFQQTTFASTVIQANGSTIYRGDGRSFLWTPTTSGTIVLNFYTELTDGTISRSELYTVIPLNTYATEIAAIVQNVTAYRATTTNINVLTADPSGVLKIATNSLSALNNPSAGTVSINLDGKSIHFVPAQTFPSFPSYASFTFQMTDGTNYFPDTVTVSITIEPIPNNQPPTISSISNQQFVEGASTNVSFTISDDYTAPENLIVTIANTSSTLTCNLIGTNSSRTLQISGPMPENDDVTITVTDEDEASTSETFHVTVAANPNLPQVTTPTYTSSDSGNSFTFNVTGATGAVWTAYSSVDLTNWTPVTGLTLDGFGTGTFTDSTLNNVAAKFYKLSNGTNTSQAIGFEQVVVVVGPGASTNTPGQNSYFADQLIDSSGNYLTNVFANISLPTNTILQKRAVNGFDSYTYSGSAWSGNTTLNPGEMGVLLLPPGSAPATLTFVGLVPEGTFIRVFNLGQWAYMSSIIPVSGKFSTVFNWSNPPATAPYDGDQINLWNGSGFDVYNAASYVSAGFVDQNENPVAEPVINIGQGISYMPGNSSFVCTQAYSAVGGYVPLLSGGILTSSTFTFNASGGSNTTWTVYSSTNLTNWTSVSSLVLDSSGKGSFTNFIPSGVVNEYYKLNNGTNTSEAIGFEKIVVNAGTSNDPGLNGYLADQLINVAGNTLTNVFANTTLPDGTVLKKWVTNDFVSYSYSAISGWSGSTTLNPGEAGVLLLPTNSVPVTVTFIGLVPEGAFTRVFTLGQWAVMSSVTPLSGAFSTVFNWANPYNSILGQGPYDGDQIDLWNGSGFDDYNAESFESTGFLDQNSNPVSEPVISTCQGLFYMPCSMTFLCNQTFYP